MSNKRLWAGLLLAVVVVVCALLFRSMACQGGKITDTWYSPPPAAFVPGLHGIPVEFSCVADHLAEAVKRLESNSVASLSEADLGYYGVDTRPHAPGLRPFLVRALLGNEGHGRFYAYLYDDSIVIDHGSLGSFPPPVERLPLVVWLAREPRQVFVSVSTAR